MPGKGIHLTNTVITFSNIVNCIYKSTVPQNYIRDILPQVKLNIKYLIDDSIAH